VVLKADALIIVLFKRIEGGAKGALLSKLKLELEGILYYLSFLSSLSLLERLVKESIGFNSLLDNPKLRKSNKSNSIVKIKGE
jgi:hypothetical protein